MKKIVILSFLTLLLVGLVAPKIVGSKLNESLNDIVVTVNKLPGYSMQIKEIESNWFSTSAVLVFDINTAVLAQNPDLELDNLSIEAKYNANHGPFRFGDNSGIGWLGWSANIDGKILRDSLEWPLETAFYEIQSNMSLLGNHSYTDTISPFTASLTEEGVDFTFSGYRGKGLYNGQSLDYKSKIGAFSMVSDDVDINASNFTFDMLFNASIEQILTSGVYTSDSKFNIDKVNVENKNSSETFILSSLYMTAVTKLDEENKLLDMQLAYGVNNINIDNFNADDVVIEVEVNNLSADFLKAFQKHNADIVNSGGEIAPDQVEEFFTNNLLPLLSENPEFNITSLRGTLPKGKFTSHFNTRLANITVLPTSLDDPSFWLTHTLVDAKINGDKAAIEWVGANIMKMQLEQDPMTDGMSDEEITDIANKQIPAMLNMFATQGFISATDSTYNSTLTLKDKVLKINDKVIPLPF